LNRREIFQGRNRG
jgi:archaellum component FlaD/FlaE